MFFLFEKDPSHIYQSPIWWWVSNITIVTVKWLNFSQAETYSDYTIGLQINKLSWTVKV